MMSELIPAFKIINQEETIMTEANEEKPISDPETPETADNSGGGGSKNTIIIIAVIVILALLGVIAYMLLSDGSADSGDQPGIEQPIAPTLEPKPEQPIAPTPEGGPEHPIAPSPEASAPSSSSAYVVAHSEFEVVNEPLCLPESILSVSPICHRTKIYRL
jgi:hypothetical protein